MRTRLLTTGELAVARSVFQITLPYNLITISDAIGMGNRAFTLPMFNEGQAAATTIGSMFLGPLAAPFLMLSRPSSYLINFGTSGFSNAITTANRATFIHELTHVWQSFNQVFSSAYIFNSIWHQAISGGSAYSYTLGQPWNNYNVEQQASIVGDWFNADNMSMGSPRFRYIQSNIRTGRS